MLYVLGIGLYIGWHTRDFFSDLNMLIRPQPGAQSSVLAFYLGSSPDSRSGFLSSDRSSDYRYDARFASRID
jgi:hypothetical protein